MSTTSRILQVIVILLGTAYFFWAVTHGKYVFGIGVLTIAVMFWATLGFASIDPTLKNPAALKYFRIAAFIGTLVIVLVMGSILVVLLCGGIHDVSHELRILATLFVLLALVWKNRRVISDLLRSKNQPK